MKPIFLCGVTVLAFLMLLPLALGYPDFENRYNAGMKVSLGNSTCQSQECDRMVLNFLVPKGMSNADVTINVHTEDLSSHFNASDIYNITLYCSNGDLETINLKTLFSGTILNYNFRFGSPGYTVVGENEYDSHWCAFRRSPSNSDKFPTEFFVEITSIGMTSQILGNDTITQQSTLGVVASSLDNFAVLNLQLWDLGFVAFEIGAIGFAFIAVVAFVPMLIKWVINKVTEK